MDNARKKVVIIGGNRGIGLGFVKAFLAQNCMVHATCREESNTDELEQLSCSYPETLRLLSLDVRDAARVKQIAKQIPTHIDYLILNAGIIRCLSGSHPLTETAEQLRESLEVNTLAPDNIMRSLFSKLLHPDACAVYISSTLSSHVDNQNGRFTSYRASKAAANIIMQNWDIELANIWLSQGHKEHNRPCAFPISPGLVQTDMGGGRGELTVKQSVDYMMSVIEKVREHKHCALYLYDGSVLQSFTHPTV